MEEQSKLLADLAVAVSSINAKLSEMHPAVLDLHTWRPNMERSVESLRAEVGDLRSRVIDLTRPSSSSTIPRGDLPPLLQLSTDASALNPPKPAVPGKEEHAVGLGGDGHGQIGHRDASNHRGDHSADHSIPGGTPAKGSQLLYMDENYLGCQK